ncbi:Lactonohydrolase oryL [Fulvia fulva]|nr:Lactonohydrolase oryL [Fulvia fulva]WPV12054.1 Lactonohydrolase oryL [Fulvia fulva]
MRGFAVSMSLLSYLTTAISQSDPPGVSSPIASTCGPSDKVVCLDRYASVLPYHFFRASGSDGEEGPAFSETSVPNDTSFGLIADADFIVFDQKRGLEVLGANPTYEYVFEVSEAVHEAPVYVPALNKLFLSQLAPPAGYLPQLVVDLNQDSPTLSEYLSDPPVYAPNGGTFYNGLIYWAASGGNRSIGGTEQRIGVRTLDPLTNKTTTLLNNYYGYYFNCVDDLFVDPRDGSIWFTDPQYSWFNSLTDTAPQLKSASYRFDPSTGETTIIEDTLSQPNGIALSPDGKHVYISDTGAVAGSIVIQNGTPFNQTGSRAVYKYDRVDDGKHLINKRAIYYAIDHVPDGLKVAQNGYVVTATGRGVDVLDAFGSLLVRVQTNYTVQNFAWTGPDLTEFWVMGQGGISRVRWDLRGQDLAARGEVEDSY